MLRNIRLGVFETNSSSMHSIAMVGSDRMETPWKGNFIIRPREYGWGRDTLKDPIEKLSYITTMIQYKDRNFAALLESDDDDLSIQDSIYFRWLAEMVRDYTGTELIYKKNKDEYRPHGHIDHQSLDILDDYWSEDEHEFKSNMRDLVFNKKYFIIIDNDNN